MKVKVERYFDGRLKSVCGAGIEVRIERYPDGRFKLVYTSSEQYESWMDENGGSKSMGKDPKFDQLLLRILNSGSSETDGAHACS